MTVVRRTAALLACVALLVGCDSGSDPGDASTTSASPTVSTSSLPSVAGPQSETAFEVVSRLGVRPGSPDDLLIRDLITVATAERAYLAVNGKVGALEDVQRASGFRLRGGKVALMSGLGSTREFCLRAYQNDESPRQWFYDTDHVLDRTEFCT